MDVFSTFLRVAVLNLNAMEKEENIFYLYVAIYGKPIIFQALNLTFSVTLILSLILK
jgi:hypothetical protein